MKRNTLLLAALAFVITALATPFQLFGLPLAPLAALVIGGIAGWRVVALHRDSAAPHGLRAGVTVGFGALLGSVIVLTLLGFLVGNLPAVQEFVRASEPNPEARLPPSLIAPLAGLGGVVSGLVFGVINLALSALGGLVAALIHGKNRTA